MVSNRHGSTNVRKKARQLTGPQRIRDPHHAEVGQSRRLHIARGLSAHEDVGRVLARDTDAYCRADVPVRGHHPARP